MAAETFPRWNLAAVDFVETDAEKIKAEIITAYESAANRTLADGDPVRLFLLTIADIIISQRNALNMTAQQNLLAYATGGYLDALGLVVACIRKDAAKAITRIRFTLSAPLGVTYTIPKGFEVTNGEVTFATDEEIQIPAGETTGEIDATCTVAGTVGNGYLAGQVNTIVAPMTFLDKAENITTTNSGADIENDAEFAERIRQAPNAFSVAGPAKAYNYHAMSVSSAIIDVNAVSPTPGYVDVYVLCENGEMPSEDMIKNVYDHLNAEDIRPLTDCVTVKRPEAKNYSINLKYWISTEDMAAAGAIKNAVEKAVEDFRIWQQSKIGRYIAPYKLAHDVIAAGASRIDLDALLAAMPYTILTGSQVAQCPAGNKNVEYMGYDDGNAEGVSA